MPKQLADASPADAAFTTMLPTFEDNLFGESAQPDQASLQDRERMHCLKCV